jgi:hypothetical protein
VAVCCWLRVEGEQGRDGNAVSTSPINLGSSGDESKLALARPSRYQTPGIVTDNT